MNALRFFFKVSIFPHSGCWTNFKNMIVISPPLRSTYSQPDDSSTTSSHVTMTSPQTASPSPPSTPATHPSTTSYIYPQTPKSVVFCPFFLIFWMASPLPSPLSSPDTAIKKKTFLAGFPISVKKYPAAILSLRGKSQRP